MKIDDFRHMRHGKTIQPLSKEQAHWLKPYDKQDLSSEHALLMLHGFSSSPAVYRELLPSLSSIYGTIVCPALPGHATDIASFSTVQASEWVHAAESACQELISSGKKVDVMGLSLGGLLSCHLANTFSLNHLYLLAPALSLKLNIPLSIGLAKFLRVLGFKSLRNKAGNIHTARSAEIAYRLLPINTIIEILTLINEFEFHPPTCSVDIFLGRYDEVVESGHVAGAFNGLPNANLHWLENSAHVLPLDGDIDSILACVKKNATF
jgi:carboxylesterase